MEKSEKMDHCDTDSITTVNVKDYAHTLDYQEAPPAYRNVKTSTTVQVTKIVAVAAVVIAAMLSTALVFSAWVTSTSCQQNQQSLPPFEALLQPEHLKSILAFGSSGPSAPAASGDLESAESKLENASNKLNNNNSNNKESDSSEEDSGEDDAVTMLKLPLELSLQEHMFERNHRSHMNCVIEKKKAEEIVDEQSKPLPQLLGINMTTDPRYLHFTGEKMAISCDSGNDHRQAPQQIQMNQHQVMNNDNQDILKIMNMRRSPHHGQPLSEILQSALAAAGSSSLPIHIIGPIPLTQSESQSSQQQFHSGPPQGHHQQHQQYPHPHHHQFQQYQPRRGDDNDNGNGPFSALGLPPHLIPVLVPQGNQIEDSNGGQSGPFFLGPQGSGEIRERALPHPIPIMPRAHVQHVIRPRSVDSKETHKRVKRCNCDCACKNHPLGQ